MFAAFKHFKTTYPRTSEVLGTFVTFTMCNIAAVALTHYRTKDLPPEVRDIYWDNFMDVEGCRAALARHERQEREKQKLK